MAQGIKFTFSMPDDESLAEYISIKGEKGDPGDPTRTSQLENDSDFTTNAALNAGLETKADATTVQELSDQVDANTSALSGLQSSRINMVAENCQNGRWYKLVDFLPVDSTNNTASVRLKGRIGGVTSATIELVDIIVANRSNGVMAYGDFYASDSAEYRGDIQVYQNPDTTSSLYLFLRNWATVDIEVYCNDQDSPLIYDGTYVTSEPSGTVVWALSTATDIQKNIDGTITADITGDAQTVNGHTVDADVPADAVFTDTIYDDSAIRDEIDDKADSTIVATTYATKTELIAVGEQISSLANGSPLTASSTSEMTDTTRVYVNTTDGHWYYYDGSSWADGGVYQATELANKSVTPQKLSFSARTSQLFDYENATIVHLIPNISTDKVVDSVKSSTLVIPCEPSTTYTINISAIGNKFVVFDTANFPTVGEAVLGRDGDPAAGRQSTKTVTFTTAATASYLSVFFYNSTADASFSYDDRIQSIMINEGSTAQDWLPYNVLDINGILSRGAITPDKLSASGIMLYKGHIYVDFDASTITVSDDLDMVLDAKLNKNITFANGITRVFTIPSSGVYILTATITSDKVSSLQLKRFSDLTSDDRIMALVDIATKTYSTPYGYYGACLAEARYAKMFSGNIIIDYANGKIKLFDADYLVGELYNQVNVDTANLPTEIDLPDTSYIYALTLKMADTYHAQSLQLEHYQHISPENYIICWVGGKQRTDNTFFAPYDYGGRITTSLNTINYENDIALTMFEHIAAIGDSYTNGQIYYNGIGYDSTDKKLSYIACLGKKNGVDWANYGVNGATTSSYITSGQGLARVLSGEKSDLYYLALGINDANKLGTSYLGTIADITNDYTQNPDSFYGNYARIIEQVQAHAPHAKFIMVGCMRPNSMNPNYGVFTAAIEEIAEHYGFPFINPYSDRFFSSNVMQTLSGNHPTSAGYTGIALALERLTARAIEENPTYFIDANYGSIVGD